MSDKSSVVSDVGSSTIQSLMLYTWDISSHVKAVLQVLEERLEVHRMDGRGGDHPSYQIWLVSNRYMHLSTATDVAPYYSWGGGGIGGVQTCTDEPRIPGKSQATLTRSRGSVAVVGVRIQDRRCSHGEAKCLLDILLWNSCLLYTSPSPRDGLLSRMPSSA